MTKEEKDLNQDQNKSTNQNKKENLIKAIVAIVSIVVIITTLFFAYQNSYGLSTKYDDIDFEYTIYEDQVNIKITPKINIKNFEYELNFNVGLKSILFNTDGYSISFKEEKARAKETISHNFSKNDIEKYLKGYELGSVSISIKNGKVQNKYTTRPEIEYKNDCKFGFALSTKEGIRPTDREYIIHCKIKNKTDKEILSVQNIEALIVFDNKNFNLKLGDIIFDKPLKPNEISNDIILDPSGTFGISANDIFNKYNNYLECSSYDKQKYSIVFNEESYVGLNTIQNETKSYVFDLAYANYNKTENCIYWNEIKNADGYYITINNGKRIKTQNTYYSIPEYKPGYYSVKIEPYDNENKYIAINPQTTQIRVNGFINEEEAKNKALSELTYHLVEINITKYNKGLFGIKKDKTTECLTGVIIKEADAYKYWCITYSPLLTAGYNYDVTNISVTDKHGTTYNATEITPTNINNRILTVIEFYTNKKLPVPKLSKNIGNIEDVILLSENTSLYTPIITKIKGPEVASEVNFTRTRYQAIITEQSWNVLPDYKAVFDENYELVGIVVTNSEFGKIRFLQIKEVVEHYDLELAKNFGELFTTRLPTK